MAKFGVQIYSIRDIYAKNAAEAFKLIKDSGYDAVDMFGGIQVSAGELKKMLDDNGLECCGWHMGIDNADTAAKLEEFAAYNKTIGNKYLIVPGLPGEYMQDKDTWKKAADKLNEIAAQLKPHGMYTGMHSHAQEFAKLDGTDDYPWDIIAKNTCENVVLQLDMGNTLHAGVDPVASLKKYKGRYQTIHMKPYSKAKGFGAKIGEDDIDWAEAVKYCKEHGGTEYFIVEYEEADAATGIKACLDGLKKYI